MNTFRVLEVDPAARGFEPRLRAELTGREDALGAIAEVYRHCVVQRACRSLTLLGEPGVGKTRLAEESTARLAGEALAIRTGCVAYGEGTTFRPIAQIIRQAAGIPEGAPAEVAERRLTAIAPRGAMRPLADLLALPGEVPRPEETFRAVRRLLEVLASDRPLAVVLDDLHWAEPALLDLLDYLTIRVLAPVLLLGAARPEIRERRPGWGPGSPRATVLEVRPLGETDAGLLAARLLGSPEGADDLCRSIVRTAGGNPLFVEELVAMLLERGTPQEAARSGPALAEQARLPPTIHAILQARLDLLPPIERSVAQAASVEGTSFHLGGVLALSGAELDEASLDAAVRSLLGRDFLRPARATLPGQPAFRFRHDLVRDAAYASLPKTSRALLHGAFASWFEATAGNEMAELGAVVGHHLERSCLLHRELGHPDDAAARVRASDHLADAGRRSLERGDARAAAGLLQRAADLLEVGTPERTRLLWPLAEALDLATGRFAHLGEELMASARALGDEVLWQAGRLLVLGERLTVEPGSIDLEEYTRTQREALAVVEVAEVPEIASWACCNLATAHWYRGDLTAALDATERMLRHLDRSGRHPPVLLLGYLWGALASGPVPLPKAARRLEREMATRAEDPVATAVLRLNMAELRAMQGRFEEAWALVASGRSELEGLPQHTAETTANTADVAWLAGDLDEAERGYRAQLEAMLVSQDLINLPSAATALAEVLVRQGRIEEAVATIETARAHRAPFDVVTRIDLERIGAAILLAEGRVEEARRSATRAVALASDSDMPWILGECIFVLAEVEGAAGDPTGAAEDARRALGLFERKGVTVRATEVRAFLDRLAR